METIIGQPQVLKKINIEQLESLIYEKGPLSKPELARLSGLSLPTVNKLVRQLEEEGKVKSIGLMGSGAGRKANVYVANEQLGNYIILYYQNNTIICCLADITGEIIEQSKVDIGTNVVFDPHKSVPNMILEMINTLKDKSRNEIKAIGIGVPGVVKDNNVISSIPNIPELEGINLKKLVEDAFEIPTFIENDIKLTTVGYYHQNLKKKYNDMIYIYFGVGLGSGIILNRKLHKGFTSFAGELGYMAVSMDSDDADYTTKGGGFESKIKELREQKNMCETMEAIAKIDQEMATLFSFAIANLIGVINPQVIVIGGEFISDRILSEIRKNITKLIPSDNIPEFIVDDKYSAGVEGAINMCISNISTGIKVINERGV